ncbi:TetR/AcrR family transcriptional regulator [Homoserinibacter sp. YIM 151385]|uniref:TetR/AcrR family transcriptional regulator n=1 Tax=Homoserinibacter sp. YIM 151385 TaxID=2985506 RepID=UPI0022F0A267|nr:TetR/AcrR family transcriptional regulator [Homoserinibacter sp. YIM 151385]WBU39296.1 helix-turn-helix domain containing protein [Homoserinibacter sp. YIM 151385]
MTTADTLRDIALDAFTASGYHATSLQQIAQRAGVSKASVLYHFASKEVLLEAAVGPALDRLEVLIDGLETRRMSADGREDFIPEFVDFLLAHRREVHIFFNHSAHLEDVPIMARAQTLIERIAAYCQANVETPESKMRIGIGLAGAAYMLAVADTFGDDIVLHTDFDQAREPLISILGELLTGTIRPAPERDPLAPHASGSVAAASATASATADV